MGQGPQRRQDITRLLQAHPGIGFRDLHRRSGIPRGSLQSHLSYMMRHGQAWQHKQGTRIMLFAGTSPMDPTAHLAAAVSQLSGNQGAILRFIQAHPGCCQQQIINAHPQISRPAIQSALGRLASQGLVASTRSRGRLAYHVTFETGPKSPAPGRESATTQLRGVLDRLSPDAALELLQALRAVSTRT